jgi:hypothetical protein
LILFFACEKHLIHLSHDVIGAGMHGELAYRRLNSEQLGWYSSADLTGRPDENALLNSLASHRSPSVRYIFQCLTLVSISQLSG